jgi:hypothetical protein
MPSHAKALATPDRTRAHISMPSLLYTLLALMAYLSQHISIGDKKRRKSKISRFLKATHQLTPHSE